MKKPKFKVGDKVTYTNEYGVVFTGKTVTEIEEVKGNYRYFYEPDDAYWVSVPEESLSPEPKPGKDADTADGLQQPINGAAAPDQAEAAFADELSPSEALREDPSPMP